MTVLHRVMRRLKGEKRKIGCETGQENNLIEEKAGYENAVEQDSPGYYVGGRKGGYEMC